MSDFNRQPKRISGCLPIVNSGGARGIYVPSAAPREALERSERQKAGRVASDAARDTGPSRQRIY